MAANSDSTLMNSHGARAPDFTISPSASTMWVCGEIGYAQITSGRQRPTASATAREPSVCLRIGHRSPGRLHLTQYVAVGFARGHLVARGHLAFEFLPDRAYYRFDRYQPRYGGEAAEQRGVRHRTPDARQCELG